MGERVGNGRNHSPPLEGNIPQGRKERKDHFHAVYGILRTYERESDRCRRVATLIPALKCNLSYLLGDTLMNYIRSKQELYGFILMTSACLILNGCGGSDLPPDMPKIYPTTITITQDDRPLEGASVVLVPMDPSNTWHAGATTDAAGNAVMLTHTQYNGVVPGKYFVIVSKFEPTRAEGVAMPDPETDPEGYARYMDAAARSSVGGGHDLVDPKFAKASPNVTIEVTEGPNTQTIDVGKAVRVERRQ